MQSIDITGPWKQRDESHIAFIRSDYWILLFSQIAFELNYEKCYPEADRLVLVRGGGENVKTGRERRRICMIACLLRWQKRSAVICHNGLKMTTVIFNFETLNVFKDGH